ncbi:hypothetical protein H6P81_013462 [Aristolochia fimbriata]|uniref:C2 domain-containing protein n=1 Tax=Aristolochia fimbriata TaxID=158543 RepID=A0AAV7EF70_ARIFI|nr:hypothetical protein H6P81_013462 [Aristolochia fimbriata]
MASKTIDLKLISCKDLKAFNFFQKLSVYAVVALGTGDGEKGNRKQQQQKTPIDREGGRNPQWNHEFRFDLSQIPSGGLFSLFIEIDLLCEGMFVDKNVGEVRVPVSDLIGESRGLTRFVSYQVRCADGKPNGVLNFSYKVNWSDKIGWPDLPSVFSLPAQALYPPEKQQQEPEKQQQSVAATPAVEYIPPPYGLGQAPLQATYAYPPPPGPMYYPPPATCCYPPPPAEAFYQAPAAYGYGYSLTGCTTIDRAEAEEPWRQYGYPALGQTESPMDNTLRRGLYPTIG